MLHDLNTQTKMSTKANGDVSLSQMSWKVVSQPRNCSSNTSLHSCCRSIWWHMSL